MAKSDAQRQREYRERKKLKKMLLIPRQQKPSLKTPPKTPKERARLYRQRKKLGILFNTYQKLPIEEQQRSLENPEPGPSASESVDLIKTLPSKFGIAILQQYPHLEVVLNEEAMVKREPKSPAERQREFRERTKAEPLGLKRPPLSPRERTRLCRERKKLRGILEAFQQFGSYYPEGTSLENVEFDHPDQGGESTGESSGVAESCPVPEIPFVEVKAEPEVGVDSWEEESCTGTWASGEPASSQPSLEEFQSAGENVARKLARMTPLQAIYAESIISNVLRLGLLQKLQEQTDVCDNSCSRRTAPTSQSHQVSTSHSPAIKVEQPFDVD